MDAKTHTHGILEEIEKRIAEEDNEDEEEQVEADELVPFEDIAMLFACTDSVDIDISIQRSIDENIISK